MICTAGAALHADSRWHWPFCDLWLPCERGLEVSVLSNVTGAGSHAVQQLYSCKLTSPTTLCKCPVCAFCMREKFEGQRWLVGPLSRDFEREDQTMPTFSARQITAIDSRDCWIVGFMKKLRKPLIFDVGKCDGRFQTLFGDPLTPQSHHYKDRHAHKTTWT